MLDQLKQYYEKQAHEELRLQKDGLHYLEFLTACRYLDRFIPPRSAILDSCAGSGAYAFHLARQGHTVSAGDIVPHNVDLMRAKQQKEPLLADIFQADASDLSRFADHSFKAVLCMGALYHLPQEEQRKKVIAESRRVLNSDGIFACTYMNRYAVILGNMAGNVDNIGEIQQFLDNGREGIFYTATPGQMEELMQQTGVSIHCHVALDGISGFLFNKKQITAQGLQNFREYHFRTCEDPTLLGYSYHNLIIGGQALCA